MISNRLKRIASYVSKEDELIDIGCDHALLDIYLVTRNKDIRAVASDIKEGPLEQAKNNIKRERLEDKIEVFPLMQKN